MPFLIFLEDYYISDDLIELIINTKFDHMIHWVEGK